ncbi:MAG: TolC family protein [Sphingobacteriaceae bacterium]|nr:TolC family protein [Sphingobacteriaceae bacterium]
MIKNFLIAFLVLSVGANAQNEWSLQQCVDYALKHNIMLQQAELSNQITKNNTTQSKAALLPNLNGGAAHTYNFGRTIDRYTNTFANTQVLSQNYYISSNLVLWSGLSQWNNMKANQYAYLAGSENIKQQKNDVALNVATAYINVIYCDEFLKIAKNQFDITKQQLDQTEKLANAGTLAKSAVYDVKAQLASEEVNVTTADNNFQIAMLTLKQFLNLDSTNNFKIANPDVEVQSQNLLGSSVQNIYETALKSQPSIKSTKYNFLMAEKTLLAAKGRVSPTISLNGSIGTGYSGLAKDVVGYNNVTDTLGYIGTTPFTYERQDPIFKDTPFNDQFKNNVNKSIGITLSVPLFNGLQTVTSVKNAKLNALNAKLGQDLAEQNLYKVIAQSYANARAALNKYVASKSSVEASEMSFTFAQQKFNVGAISAFDFNTAKSRLVTAQSNLLQAKFDYLFKLKVLDFYQGKPLTF